MLKSRQPRKNLNADYLLSVHLCQNNTLHLNHFDQKDCQTLWLTVLLIMPKKVHLGSIEEIN